MINDDLTWPDDDEQAALNARNAELSERDQIRDIVIAHIDELSMGELRAVGRRLTAIERGRRLVTRTGLTHDDGAAHVSDVVAYLTLQLEVMEP